MGAAPQVIQSYSTTDESTMLLPNLLPQVGGAADATAKVILVQAPEVKATFEPAEPLQSEPKAEARSTRQYREEEEVTELQVEPPPPESSICEETSNVEKNGSDRPCENQEPEKVSTQMLLSIRRDQTYVSAPSAEVSTQVRPSIRRDQTYVSAPSAEEVTAQVRPSMRRDQTYVSAPSAEVEDATSTCASSEGFQNPKSSLEFEADLMRGRSCTYLEERSGRRFLATCTLDQDLNLVVDWTRSSFPFLHASVKFPIVSIEDVDDFAGCNLCLQPSLRASLTEDERSRLLMVYYKVNSGKTKSICLLEDSHQSMDYLSGGLINLKNSAAK